MGLCCWEIQDLLPFVLDFYHELNIEGKGLYILIKYKGVCPWADVRALINSPEVRALSQ